VSGYLFKILRESIRLTQVELAERLEVDVATVQGWESGRRPLTALRAGDLMRLRASLIRLGVQPSAFSALHDAVEADLVIADAVEAGEKPMAPERHLLASSVHRRSLTNLITWPFTGAVPPQVTSLSDQRPARRGPVADRPVLDTDERTRFFDHLLITADAFRDDTNALLRRQAIYLLGFDVRPGTVDWLTAEQRRAVRVAAPAGDVPAWLAVRSSAVALACNGERDALRDFVSSGLADDTQQTANLNYWAYWVGEIPEVHADDGFMANPRSMTWSGLRLFEHLLDRLRLGSDHAELNIHTLWSLLLARPSVLEHHSRLRAMAREKLDRVADDPDLVLRSRQELASVAYAIRLADR